MILVFVFVCGCISDDNQVDNLYKGIATAVIPDECIEFKDDVCALYECMVEDCWCDDFTSPSSILYEPSDVTITNEVDAINIVEVFIQENATEYSQYETITNAVKLNDVFYNVFAENTNSEEISFIVAADGVILKTTCGV